MNSSHAAGAAPCPIRKLSILIPVYNEIRTLQTIIRAVLEAPLPCERELVVVDDCSRDGSREWLVEFAKTEPRMKLILHEQNSGKGQGIRTAIANMTGDWALIQDADLEYDPNEYQLLLEPAIAGIADAVYGSRFLTGRYRRAMYFWHTLANKMLTVSSNIFNDLNLTDMETCYKLVRADILKNLNLRSRGFDLEPEITAKLARWGARIYEVPISYRGRTYAEGKKIGLRDAYQALWAMIRYRYLDRDYCKHEGFMILQAVRHARRFNRWLFGQFKQYIGHEVLEAGCGIGNLTELVLDRKRLVCIDAEEFYVDRLEQAYGHLLNTRLLRADLTSPTDMAEVTREGLFDSTFCINVAEHIEDDVTALRNLSQTLKPGGHLVVLVPHGPGLYTEVDRTLGHFRRYTSDELRAKLTEAGLEVVELKRFNRLGGLGWWISGKLLRRRTLSKGQMKSFEFLMPVARVLEHVPLLPHNSVIGIARVPAEKA